MRSTATSIVWDSGVVEGIFSPEVLVAYQNRDRIHSRHELPHVDVSDHHEKGLRSQSSDGANAGLSGRRGKLPACSR